MNALVAFRSGALGNLSPTREQRQAATEQISALLRARTEKSAVAATAKSMVATAEKAGRMEQTLGEDVFLQLLVMQMQNQDPTEPVDNTEMIAQLAQFTSLEQMTQLNESFEELQGQFDFPTGNVDQLNFITAQGLLGKYVNGVLGDGTIHSGTVESVHLDGSIVVLTVDGKPMPMTGVMGVFTEEPQAPPTDGEDTGGEEE